MPRKAFEVKVELDIQAISCPGVWLCPNGKVCIQLYMLDSCIQTTSLQPVFPLLYHESFIFYKTFHTVHRLSELQKVLNKEFMYAELIQWQDCETGNVLASFKTTLNELLYPTTIKGSVPGIDIDLLMEPEKHFPGIIAPKIEVSTRTTIEEKLCSGDVLNCDSYVVNPKVLTSKCFFRPTFHRQKKVCHSAGYHRSKTCPKKEVKREKFLYRRPDDNLIGRKPQGLSLSDDYCRCRTTLRNKYHSPEKSSNRDSGVWALKVQPRHQGCVCSHGETSGNCQICAKYKFYFEPPASPPLSGFKARAYKVTQQPNTYKQCDAHPEKACVCSASNNNADQWTSPKWESGRSRKCECGRSNLEQEFEKTSCMCSQRKSLAEKLHDRLSKTLKCASDCSDVENKTKYNKQHRADSPICHSNCSPLEVQCNEDTLSEKCSNWYGSFDRFYKQFYRNRNGCDKYITC